MLARGLVTAEKIRQAVSFRIICNLTFNEFSCIISVCDQFSGRKLKLFSSVLFCDKFI